MKKIVGLMLLCLSTFYMLAQDNYTTQLEGAMKTKNSLFKQEIFSVENIPAFRVDAVKVTDLEKFNIVTGCRIVQKLQFGKELKTFNNFIDKDEIEQVVTALQYMKTIVKSKTIPASYTEIKFNTKAGFQVMLLTVLDDFKKLTWSFMVQTNLNEEKTLVTLPLTDIDKLQAAFEQAKVKL